MGIVHCCDWCGGPHTDGYPWSRLPTWLWYEGWVPDEVEAEHLEFCCEECLTAWVKKHEHARGPEAVVHVVL